MYSGLSFDIDGMVITFSAYELICLAEKIVNNHLAEATIDKIEMPDHGTIDETLDERFWQFTKEISNKLENFYQLPKNKIYDFLAYAYGVTTIAPHLIYTIVTHPQNRELLNHIKAKEKNQCFEIMLDKHIILPMKPIHLKSIDDWLLIAKYLADNYLKEESLSGWWFQIGGRIIRVRNDVSNGALREKNKQFYASDHGFEETILNKTSQEIFRCLKNFTWGKDGTYFRAFKFWEYFTLQSLREYEVRFVERLNDNILKSNDACENLFVSLQKLLLPLVPPAPLPEPNLPALKRKIYKRVYDNTFMNLVKNLGCTAMTTDASDWIKRKFLTGLTDEIIKSKKKCDQLLEDCIYSYYCSDIPIRYKDLPEATVKLRTRKFEQIFNSTLQVHQDCLKEEFISRMNDEIALSPKKCQLLLLSLAIENPDMRGRIEEDIWSVKETLNLGSRDVLVKPEISNPDLSSEARKRYAALFDDLIEQFHYVSQVVIGQQVELMDNSFGPFHTQIRQIMHETMSENYILVHILNELAKAINHGKHDPLFREVAAYGDREAGDSYHKFETAITNYLQSHQALTESELAAKMRAVLEGEKVTDEKLGFLPCLVAAWFISESTRNPLTTMTSLMLLDMLQSNVTFLTDDGKHNWYCWRNVLIHPHKGSNIGKAQDLYRKRINLDEFGGCHPMVNQGSVSQSSDKLDANVPLTITRQKEGHILSHWLQLKTNALSQNEKAKYGLKKVTALTSSEFPNNKKDVNALQAEIAQKEKQIKKDEGTIRVKKKNQPNADVSKYENNIQKLNEQVEIYSKQLKQLQLEVELKKKVQTEIIEPLLKLRLSCLKNLLSSQPQLSGELHDGFVPAEVTQGLSALPRFFEPLVNRSAASTSNRSLSAQLARESESNISSTKFKEILLQKYGLSIDFITPDGNCQFRAISRASLNLGCPIKLPVNKTEGKDEYLLFKKHPSEEEIIASLRSKAVKYIDKNREYYQVFLANHIGADADIGQDLAFNDLEDYLKKISQDKEYGDNFTIHALGQILQKPIIVLRPGSAEHPVYVNILPVTEGVPLNIAEAIIVVFNGIDHYDFIKHNSGNMLNEAFYELIENSSRGCTIYNTRCGAPIEGI